MILKHEMGSKANLKITQVERTQETLGLWISWNLFPCISHIGIILKMCIQCVLFLFADLSIFKVYKLSLTAILNPYQG